HPAEIRPYHISQRVSASEVRTYAELYPVLEHGELLDGIRDPVFAEAWKLARPDSFQRAM
ncbi:MAG: FMN-binding glutamate synthase family protein, partial [Hyphomicrobiaceae bacterium]